MPIVAAAHKTFLVNDNNLVGDEIIEGLQFYLYRGKYMSPQIGSITGSYRKYQIKIYYFQQVNGGINHIINGYVVLSF